MLATWSGIVRKGNSTGSTGLITFPPRLEKDSKHINGKYI